jgi:hypothetical protein
MTLTKENVCVFIENEMQLEEAKRILKKYDETHTIDGTFSLDYDSRHNFLQIFIDCKWWLGKRHISHTEITLSKLELILKNI